MTIRVGNRSIRRKLLVSMLLTTLVALVFTGLAMVLYDQHDYRARKVADLTTQARILALANTPALQFSDPKVARDSLATLAARPKIETAALYDAHGTLFATYRNSDSPHSPFPPKPGPDGTQVQGDNLILFQRIADHGEMLGTLYLKVQYGLAQRELQYAGIVLVVMVFALGIAMALSLWLQTQVTRPLSNITDLARKVVEQRDFSLRAHKTTEDEIGYLVDAFNDLLSEVGRRSAALEAANAQLEQRVGERTAELERTNRELEAFSYSVSHDLRTPLRAIDGFSQALLEDYHDQLDATGRDYLARVRAGAQRMGQLIDDLLQLSRVSRAELNIAETDLTVIARQIANELREQDPQRSAEVDIGAGLTVMGDARLLRIALENLLGNAWKYTGKRTHTQISLSAEGVNSHLRYCVRDNGAGFDMAYAGKLFGAFQRLHDAREFPGTGVGLATVQRIIHRHGGEIWAEAEIDKGSAFYFTLPAVRRESNDE